MELLYTSLTNINNYLPLFFGPDNSNSMKKEDTNDILLPAITNLWVKQENIKGWDF